MKPYNKRHLSFSQQANLLTERGLIGERSEIEKVLRSVSYYRLSAYWYPFRIMDASSGMRKKTLMPGITLERVWNHYRFDRDLRLLFADAIERIEIALRTQIVYWYTELGAPFDYAANEKLQAKIDSLEKQAGIDIANRTVTSRCKEDCVKHYYATYDTSENCHLPFWIFAEISDFGS